MGRGAVCGGERDCEVRGRPGAPCSLLCNLVPQMPGQWCPHWKQEGVLGCKQSPYSRSDFIRAYELVCLEVLCSKYSKVYPNREQNRKQKPETQKVYVYKSSHFPRQVMRQGQHKDGPSVVDSISMPASVKGCKLHTFKLYKEEKLQFALSHHTYRHPQRDTLLVSQNASKSSKACSMRLVCGTVLPVSAEPSQSGRGMEAADSSHRNLEAPEHQLPTLGCLETDPSLHLMRQSPGVAMTVPLPITRGRTGFIQLIVTMKGE